LWKNSFTFGLDRPVELGVIIIGLRIESIAEETILARRPEVIQGKIG
jgi:hypothetical protein